MKRIYLFAAAFTLSTSVLAGNMSTNNAITSMHGENKDKQFLEKALQNEDMQRLHKAMTRNGISEVGMEARRQMIGKKEGRAYHKAMEYRQKNTAG